MTYVNVVLYYTHLRLNYGEAQRHEKLNLLHPYADCMRGKNYPQIFIPPLAVGILLLVESLAFVS